MVVARLTAAIMAEIESSALISPEEWATLISYAGRRSKIDMRIRLVGEGVSCLNDSVGDKAWMLKRVTRKTRWLQRSLDRGISENDLAL